MIAQAEIDRARKDIGLQLIAGIDVDIDIGAAKLAIEATHPPDEDIARNGKYVLELEGASISGDGGEWVKFEGKIDCSAGLEPFIQQ